MQRTDLLEKTLMLGKIEGTRKRGQQRVRWLANITTLMDMDLCKLQDLMKDKGAWCAAAMGLERIGHDLVTEQHKWRQ